MQIIYDLKVSFYCIEILETDGTKEQAKERCYKRLIDGELGEKLQKSSQKQPKAEVMKGIEVVGQNFLADERSHKFMKAMCEARLEAYENKKGGNCENI